MNGTLEIIFGLLGGLAVFIFGMNMMSDCLQKAAVRLRLWPLALSVPDL